MSHSYNRFLVVMSDKYNEKLEKYLDDFLIGKDGSPDKTIETLKQLNNFPRKDAVEILNFFALKETNPDILFHIVQKLGKYKCKSSIEPLIEILTYFNKSNDRERYLKVRCAAAGILGDIKNDNAIISLMYIMNDKDEYYKLRLTAAEALGKIGNPYAVLPLINLASDEEEKSVYVRESAVKALAMIGDERAADPLITIMETKKGIIDKFTFLKERIIETLGKLGFKQDKKIDALSKALFDESPHVKIRAIEALSEIEDESVLSLVEPMIFDENEEVAISAINAVYNLEDGEYLSLLLERDNLPSYCREEIEEILAEEDESGEEDE